jgi:thiamine biosynthesis lipoprotein ApbE
VLATAQRVAAASGGAFDVTCGPLVALWRAARQSGVLPTEGAIASALQLSGYPALELDAERRRAWFAAPAMRLDLGGIAKGYACAEARDVLARHGVPSALVELGGDLAVGAPPPGETGWSIDAGCGAVAGAGAGAGTGAGAATRLLVSHGSVATSGDSAQGFVIGGVRYSHVLDPRTGRALATPADSAPVCCTVVARDGALADALASACRVLGPRAGQALVAPFAEDDAELRLVCEDGSRPLFDGRTLAGWTARGGRHDGDARWSVEDGCLVGRTGPGDAGGLLYTESEHTSFELSLQCRLDRPFDSGLFVRMVPDARGAQLTLDDRPDGEVGGLYSEGWLAHAGPAAAKAWRRGAWNHVLLRCTGFDLRMQAWINGVPGLDATVPQAFAADGRPVYAPRGRIGLQVHGGGSEAPDARACFRDVRVRDLPVLGEESAEAGAALALDWEELVGSGAGPTALSAWEAVDGEGAPRAPHDWRAFDGVLHVPSRAPGGYLRTRADYRDFVLRGEFRLARMANGGLFVRGKRERALPDGRVEPAGNPAYSGCEIQLIDDFNWGAVTGTELLPWQRTGSLYGALAVDASTASGVAGAAPVSHLRPIGEWNTLEVLCRGSRIAVALNGRALYDVDTHALTAEPPFAARAPGGFLGLQRYAAADVEGDTAIWLRGLRVRRL